mmetsp:Transcript_28103/g.38848  ORF Transcript_28103/g.38848 Transcript_28103/m.38848 type:complete len:112 (-) Transcript_28103:128-463(-)
MTDTVEAVVAEGAVVGMEVVVGMEEVVVEEEEVEEAGASSAEEMIIGPASAQMVAKAVVEVAATKPSNPPVSPSRNYLKIQYLEASLLQVGSLSSGRHGAEIKRKQFDEKS